MRWSICASCDHRVGAVWMASVHWAEPVTVRQIGGGSTALGCGRGPQGPTVDPASGGPDPAGRGILAHQPHHAPARSVVRGVEGGGGPDHRPPRTDARSLQPRKRFAKGTVLIVDRTLVSIPDHTIARAVEELPALHQPSGRHRRRHPAGRRGRPAGWQAQLIGLWTTSCYASGGLSAVRRAISWTDR